MPRNQDPIRKAIAEQAAEWIVRLDEGLDAFTRREFDQWLAESPVHMEEFLLVRGATRAVLELDTSPDADGGTSAFVGTPIVSPPASARPESVIAESERSASGSHYRWRLWAAAALVLLSIGAYVAFERLSTPKSYSAAIGQRPTFTLEDGSTVQLNTRSRIDVSFSKGWRDIRLVQGEALFQVAHDVKRPFRVWTGHVVTEAVGTQFNVYLRPRDTWVTVIEGRVRLCIKCSPSASSDGSPSLLSAGEKARVSDDGEVDVKHATSVPTIAVPGEIAWTLGKIYFDAAPLSEVVREFNRYSTQQLIIADPDLPDIRYAGLVNSDSPQDLLTALRVSFGIQAPTIPSDTGEIRLSRRAR